MPDEIDTLIPVNTKVTLSSGLELEIQPLRTRELLKFLKILTHGAGSMLARIDLTSADSESEFIGRLLSLVALSIPDAEEETIEFISAMTKPTGLIQGRNLSKSDKEANVQRWTELRTVLDNPELEDLLDILEAIIRIESAEMQALGKRLRQMINLAQKANVIPESPKSTSEDGPEPSTLSNQAMDGQIEGF